MSADLPCGPRGKHEPHPRVPLRAAPNAHDHLPDTAARFDDILYAVRFPEVYRAVMNAKMPMILDGNFKPGFRIELHIKHLQNALDTAHALNVPIPLTAHVMETLQALKGDEMGRNDHSAIVRHYEKLAKVEVRK